MRRPKNGKPCPTIGQHQSLQPPLQSWLNEEANRNRRSRETELATIKQSHEKESTRRSNRGNRTTKLTIDYCLNANARAKAQALELHEDWSWRGGRAGGGLEMAAKAAGRRGAAMEVRGGGSARHGSLIQSLLIQSILEVSGSSFAHRRGVCWCISAWSARLWREEVQLSR